MKMRLFFNFWLIIFGFVGSILSSQCQPINNYSVVLEELSFPQLPSLQSFVVGQNNEGKYLLMGGRTDGLHRRQPWATFWESENNKNIYVVDISSEQVWSANLNVLPQSLFEQLQSTNMEFKQVGNYLYVIGGYGYSTTADDHITYPYLTVIDVPATIEAIVNNQPIEAFFRQIEHPAMQVTGGYLGYLDNTFYLVGGQKFMGRYNPMGPDHGPGFIQEYTNQIRKFGINDNGIDLTITNYTAITDTLQLHRRDYNLVPQIFPNGTRGFTAFSGVFQYTQDIPWLNTVDIVPEGYMVNNDFEQLLNQYHTAHAALYDPNSNVMHTILFGGIGRYYFDDEGQLIDDSDVPFVKTISLVIRKADGTMEEFDIGKMPDFLGASAEFIPLNSVTLDGEGEIVMLNQLNNNDTTLIGYIYGGILSSADNIFFINEGNESTASNKIYKIYLAPNTSTSATVITAQAANTQLKPSFSINATPNPSQSNLLLIKIQAHKATDLTLEWLSSDGQLLNTITQQHFEIGEHIIEWPIPTASNQTSGIYLLKANDGTISASVKIIR